MINDAELNFIRAVKDDVIYLILMLKFNRPVFLMELATVLKVHPVKAYKRLKYLQRINLVKRVGKEQYILTRPAIDFLYCAPFADHRIPAGLFQNLPHRACIDNYLLRRALASEPLHEV
jgi:hypothetical protein